MSSYDQLSNCLSDKQMCSLIAFKLLLHIAYYYFHNRQFSVPACAFHSLLLCIKGSKSHYKPASECPQWLSWILSCIENNGTHDCAIDSNSILGCSMKPIFTGSDAIGHLGNEDLGRRDWREKEKTTLSFLLEIPKDSLNVNEKGRQKCPLQVFWDQCHLCVWMNSGPR